MPGEDVADAIATAESFQPFNIINIFTRLGENIKDLSEAKLEEKVDVAEYEKEILTLKAERDGLKTQLQATIKIIEDLEKTAEELKLDEGE